tara:strand:+ start:18137 stop:18775 length:639 start_codon:yes stop_codon:yes gene_type:complete
MSKELTENELNSLVEFSKRTEYSIKDTYNEWVKYNYDCIYDDTIEDGKEVSIFEFEDNDISLTIFRQKNHYNNGAKELINISDKYVNDQSGWFFNNYMYGRPDTDLIEIFAKKLDKVKFEKYNKEGNIVKFEKDLGGCLLTIFFENEYIEYQRPSVRDLKDQDYVDHHNFYDKHQNLNVFLDDNIDKLNFKPSIDVLKCTIRDRNLNKALSI